MTLFPNYIKGMNNFRYERSYDNLRTNLRIFTYLRAEARW